MANFTPNKFDINSINGGQRFVDGDGITPDAINAPIESALFMQSLATKAPDISEANNVGNASVSIIEDESGARFKFSNLKGEPSATTVYRYSVRVFCAPSSTLYPFTYFDFSFESTKPFSYTTTSINISQFIEFISSCFRPLSVIAIPCIVTGETEGVGVFTGSYTSSSLYDVSIDFISSNGQYERFVLDETFIGSIVVQRNSL